MSNPKRGYKLCAKCRYRFKNNAEKYTIGLGRGKRKIVCKGCFHKNYKNA